MSLYGLAATNTPALLSPVGEPRRPVCEGLPEAKRQVVRQTLGGMNRNVTRGLGVS